ncbi:hypothetical protein AgCh_001695 [Apium graveolens]
MRSSVNNAQKATDGDKSPPTSLEPFGLHPSLRLPPTPPLPVDLTKIERVTDGDKSPPTSLEPFGLHPSPRLPPSPPLPVDLTKIERVPINQGIGTMDAYLEMQKQKREMQNTQDKQVVTTNLEAHHQTFASLTEILETANPDEELADDDNEETIELDFEAYGPN